MIGTSNEENEKQMQIAITVLRQPKFCKQNDSWQHVNDDNTDVSQFTAFKRFLSCHTEILCKAQNIPTLRKMKYSKWWDEIQACLSKSISQEFYKSTPQLRWLRTLQCFMKCHPTASKGKAVNYTWNELDRNHKLWCFNSTHRHRNAIFVMHQL